jgi:cephalosporin-C deacetylase-like acetyl esterase
MIPTSVLSALLVFGFISASWVVRGQEYGKADRENPGDEMIQEYLRVEAEKLEAEFLAGIQSRADWERERPRLMGEYFHMLGLSPLPEKTPLKATITRTLDRGDYFVDMLHYQSRPGLYVTANLYRPAKVGAGEKLPAVLYVCGHSARGRNGNKTAFQSHGIWLARHGYICLMVDTLQLGEISGIHHGTYREERWWWLSRGYTPAGVEAWNGVRGIDYLVSRADVDAERVAVTGISGGGAATFWIAAADERAKVAVPVSGMADLVSYLPSRMINGHCDCMFLYNTYQWHWTQIAGLIAPRPQLFVNSDNDPIFPMDANERIINRLERLYSHFGASGVVDAFVSIGGHDYREDIRQGVFRFLNTHLKHDSAPVTDTEMDLVTGNRDDQHPIRPEDLRVFPKDENIPSDALNGRIDEHFVEIAEPELPKTKEEFTRWKETLVGKLREVTFRHFPEGIPSATLTREEENGFVRLKTEGNIEVRGRVAAGALENADVITMIVSNEGLEEEEKWVGSRAVFVLEPRGIGATKWTTKNPPNYVERSHYLLGRTVDSGRVWDIIAAAKYLKKTYPKTRLQVNGEGRAGVLAIFAALLEDRIDWVSLGKIPLSLMDGEAPALLNALRVCDVPEALGMLAGRVRLEGEVPEKTRNIFMKAGHQ